MKDEKMIKDETKSEKTCREIKAKLLNTDFSKLNSLISHQDFW